MPKIADRSNFFSYKRPIEVKGDKLLRHATSRFQTHLPKNGVAQKVQRLSHHPLTPWRATIRCLAYAIEPLPGKNKNQTLLGVVKRIAALVGMILLLPLGLACLPLALPFHLASHRSRPNISMIHNPNAPKAQNSGDALHVRTHNLGFVYEFMRVVGDLRDVKTRANEIGEWLDNDPNLPEVVFFQEAFHIDGTRVLCDRLKEKYPYVIHNIAPHALGLNNGAIIASKHPIAEFSYRPFDNMLGPEKWSNRGLLKIRIEKNGKKIDVYGTHLQALLGKERAAVRKTQMEQIIAWVNEDQKKNPSDTQILVGDMNASKITVWGEESHEDDALFELINKNFRDVFLNNHNEDGERVKGTPQFTKNDTPDGVKGLKEPSGSWYIGPFADKGNVMKLKEWHERVFNHVPVKEQAKKIPNPHHWGTKKWAAVQHACSARFDFILRRISSHNEGSQDRAEIRRVKVEPSVQSAPSDHLPVDSIIKI